VLAGRYAVRRKLGEGGMGEVYLATHVHMERPCALKVLKKGMLLDDAAVRRFQREARNASRISHPNVTTVYDFGDAGDGMFYLAMEYIEGETLADCLAIERSLPLPRVAELTCQIAEALTSAHELGIVHRDLKPANVLLCQRRDGMVAVKVVDFGISKLVLEPGADGTSSSSTAVLMGTPTYMSPEQFLGEPVDLRSDVYSLGLVTFEMLTGELPFEATGREGIMLRLSQPPRTLVDARPDVEWPGELERVMARALAVRPAERYATARAFARELALAVTAWLPPGGNAPAR
jgi:eukaryotic-like serine/threonine-protein kinase